MFKSEASLFFSAYNNLNSAKTFINECKRLISEMELQGNLDYTKCKNNITNCDINRLTNLVETTKESLMKLDSEFANEYMTLLYKNMQMWSIDTSNMTQEEQMQYNISMNGYARDYNYSLLYMLEKYEESGMLTPEMQLQLEMQRKIIEQYDVLDQMSVVVTSSQKYIDLLKKNAELDKYLINLNPNLTDEEKLNYLKQYEKSFNSTLEVLELNRDVARKTDELKKLEAGSEAYYKKENEIRQIQINFYGSKETLTDEEKKQLNFLKDGVELNELYIDKEQNKGFWHPFIEREYDEAILDKKISMGIATEDEIAYDKMNGWERALENTKTFLTSVVFSIGSVTETVADGLVMGAGKVGNWFEADTQWAEDFVSIHYADDAYTGLVQSDCINSVSAYSGYHTAGNVLGTTAGCVGLSFLPGGPVVTGLAGGFSAMGSSSQRALDSGATFDEAFWTGTVSFGAGFVSGWGIGKFNAFASANTTSLLQVGRNVLIGGGISTLEPIVNSVAEYAIYANDIVDENRNKLYDNVWDYYIDGGGFTNTIMAFGAGGISTGVSSIKGYKQVKDIYASDSFKAKKDGYQWFEDNCTDVKKLENALTEQFNFLKKKGYKDSYLDFLSEYTSGNFSKPINFDAAVADAKQFGAVTILDGDGLNNVSKFGSLGRGADGAKQGASFATPNTSQSALETRLTNQSQSNSSFDLSVEERAAKGINTASAQNGFYKVEYTPEFFADNPNTRIYHNSGPNGINGASDAAMPGGYTYDLHSKGNGVIEVCIGDIKINSAAADAISDYVMLGTGGVLDLGTFDNNLKGIKIISYGW